LYEKHFDPVSIHLSAPVWNLLPLENSPLIAIEQRDELRRVASFSLYHFGDHKFLWRDLVLPEKWWVNLAGVSNEWIVLKVFESTENPDKTSFLFLNVKDGSVVANAPQQFETEYTNTALYPFQYLDGEPDFDTVQRFLSTRFDATPRLGAEYLEQDDLVIISFYTGNPAAFINRLVIVNSTGKCLYEDEIGMNLKGIGVNTFFVASGNLFFVKNKSELVTFRIV